MGETIQLIRFSEIDLDDPFFDSLKADYVGFEQWFKRKAQEGTTAFVQYVDQRLCAILYLKDEGETELNDVTPSRPAVKRLKVGTFKIDAHNTRLGERFVKKITDVALQLKVAEIYVTIYPKHEGLIRLLNTFGFEHEGMKGEEWVLVKQMNRITGDILKDFPLMSVRGKQKYNLAIYPKYHSRMFPDSILKNEERDRSELVRDVSVTNSIHKVYICYMKETNVLKPGDVILVYRSTDKLYQAHYRSVVTSVCQIEEVKCKNEFRNYEEFESYASKYSIFSHEELQYLYRKDGLIVLKMTYNAALKKRVPLGFLRDNLGMGERYWGFFPLTDSEFEAIIKQGEIDEGIIID